MIFLGTICNGGYLLRAGCGSSLAVNIYLCVLFIYGNNRYNM